MNTSLLVAALLVASAAPARALTPGKTDTKTVQGNGADPADWDPAAERTNPTQWWVVNLTDDPDTKYVAYAVPAGQRTGPAYKPSAKDNPAVKGKPRRFQYALPLFKVAAGGTSCAKDGAKNVCTVVLAASDYKLELGAGGESRVVNVKDGSLPAISSPLKMNDDPTSLQGVDFKDASLALRMTPPGRAQRAPDPTRATASPTDDAALGTWEQLAWDNIAKLEGVKDADAKTNKDRRAKLGAALDQYSGEFGDKGGKASQPLQALEIGFIQGRLGADAKGYDLVGGSSAKNPEKDAFTQRWRAFILKDLAGYKGNPGAGYLGSTSALNEVRRAQLNAPDAPKSDLEQKLEAIHPSKTRRDAAQRAVVAAYLLNNKDSKREAKEAYDKVMAGKPVDFVHLYNDLAKNWIPAQIKNDKAATLAGVPKETLLDAYCDPNGFAGGAAGNGSDKAAMRQLKATTVASTKGAGTADTESAATTAGGTINGNAASGGGDPLGAECSARLKDMRSRFQDEAPRNPLATTGSLNPSVNDALAGPDHFSSSRSKIDGKTGDNQGPDSDAGDSKTLDHVRMGAGMGMYFGLLGMIGGPMGLLVGGLLGFALGFGLDKLTNKPG